MSLLEISKDHPVHPHIIEDEQVLTLNDTEL